MRFNLKSMSFEDLVALRDNLEQVISQKATAARQELEEKLAALESLTGVRRGPKRRGVLAGTKVAPKFHNPRDRSQTWSGRGRTPLWLQAMLKQGHKLEEFAIRATAAIVKPAAKRTKGKKRGPKKAK
jgi:DNA-binding protein H-NS